MVALELEVLAKKLDRFGWERDRGSAAHDRIVTDWMDALQDYPLDEVKAACREAIVASPGKMPNEGHIIAKICEARASFLRRNPPREEPEPERTPCTAEAAAEIIKQAGLTGAIAAPKRFGGGA